MIGREDVGYIAVRNALAKERGIHPNVLEKESRAKRKSIDDLTVTADGSYTVLEIDRFAGDHRVHQRYVGSNAHVEALSEARRLTAEGMKYASDASVATVYYAYDPRGNYLGGNVWNRE